MPAFKNDQLTTRQRPNWREYQSSLRRPGKLVTLRRLLLSGMVVAVVFYALFKGVAATRPVDLSGAVVQVPTPVTADNLIGKSDVQLLLSRLALNELMSGTNVLPFNNQRFHVETCLDADLQNMLIRAMDRRHSRYIGIVVMEADTGRVLAMAGFDKADPDANPCLDSHFPAASLFKIVTAAAAVEQYQYTGNTTVRFNGYQHTMYRSQLREVDNRHTHRMTFADAFAQSVNPVFGKLGKLNLGQTMLVQYGLGFGFNQPIDFELPIAPSRLTVKETPYHWAEIASGFNRDTTISPIHAAMIVSAILNQGRMVAPMLVARIEDESGRLLYRSRVSWAQQAMTAEAAAILAAMMETTVRTGTARAAFSGWQRDPVLSGLHIGGKTGSIFTRSRDARIDWFAGFGARQEGPGKLVVAAMVAHEEYIGVRAAAYARMAMAHYFKNTPTRQEQTAGQ